MFVSDAPLVNNNGDNIDNIDVTAKDENGDEVTLFISASEDAFIAEQTTETFFIYSQKYIINTLIPELEALAANFIPEPDSDITAASYMNQANKWRKVIQQNEKTKYEAKNNREEYKEAVLDSLKTVKDSLYQVNMNDLVNENFFSNQSFDAGLGEFTSSITTATINSDSFESTIEVGTEFMAQAGFLQNNVGAILNYRKTSTSVDVDATTSESDVTSTISYTLKDNDRYNSFSVDIVNMFDGNGPVFITRGGVTNCPYEPATTSLFYNYQQGVSDDLLGTGGEPLSFATNRLYFGQIEADETNLTNVPEDDSAIFILQLQNKSEDRVDLEYVLEVDALSLNGLETNIEANGLNIYIPYGETVEFPFEVSKSSSSDVFKYDDIRVWLKTPCDYINDSGIFIDLSVEFKKSCSNVTLSTPQDNFIFNRAKAYSKDASGNETTKPLRVTFTDFDADFNGFRKIELQYRNASSPYWTELKTYTQDLLDGEQNDSGEVIFNWDVVGNKIPDGDYEFRAISYCTDEVTNISPIVSGTVNLKAPVVFGTPQPSDGILDIGEDILVRFSEDVFKDTSTSIKLTGLRNQQLIDHSVSVLLDGGANRIELPNQRLPKGSFTLQFWLKNNDVSASGILMSQEDGVQVTLNQDVLKFQLGTQYAEAALSQGTINSAAYNFYSLVYQAGDDPMLLIFRNGAKIGQTELDAVLDVNTSNALFIGGQGVKANIHDVRFWSKTFTPAQANVAKDKTLSGNELQLLGYWPLNEGYGTVGIDKAKSRNAIIGLDWDIKPKGTAYEFANNSYLSLDNVAFVQPTVNEDITLSFWIKTATAAKGTIFSNGRGNDEDDVQRIALRNKWSVEMNADGKLVLWSENIAYDLTQESVADGTWHHIAIVVKRGGSMNSYVDGLENSSVSSENIGGISGAKFLVGARLYAPNGAAQVIDNNFTGSLDEIRLWNTARSFEQIKRDRYFEIDQNTTGLQLYLNFNKEAENKDKGPRYYHAAVNNAMSGTYALLSAGSAQAYLEDSPPLKPKLQFTDIPLTTVINGDEVIIQPSLTAEDWALFEGQILDVSVEGLKDEHFNRLVSPVSWSFFVDKQEIEWFTVNQTKELTDEKNVGESYRFTMDIVNKGGSNQPFAINGLPTWLSVTETSGTVSPNASKELEFTIDKDLAIGSYNAELFLETASGFYDRLSLNMRVLSPAPDWSVAAPDFSNSMNFIGKIKVNDVFARDVYTKVGAFVNNVPRGEAYLQYDQSYDSYFVYLTAYSNVSSGEEVQFKIWDAINGKVIAAAIDGAPKTILEQNRVVGYKAVPAIFSGADFVEQNTALNEGWTWVSFFVEDARFATLKDLFAGLSLGEGDQIKSQATFANYEDGDWYGSLTSIENDQMYKVKLAASNTLTLLGNDVDETSIDMTINEGWNWLSFPIHRNVRLEEALTYYTPTDGDVIKDQYNFAIYDSTSGWSGTLNYMESNRGYMLKSAIDQTLNFPNSNTSAKSVVSGQPHSAQSIRAFSRYASNMSVVAEVLSDDAYTNVYVYDEQGVLRGTAPVVRKEGRQFSYISVFSDASDSLTFALYDGLHEVPISTPVVFENNKVLGSMNAPYALSPESLSTDEFTLGALAMYPNPFATSFTVKSLDASEKLSSVRIFNVLGALVVEESLNSYEKTIDTSQLVSGVYLVKVTSESGKQLMKRIVKK